LAAHIIQLCHHWTCRKCSIYSSLPASQLLDQRHRRCLRALSWTCARIPACDDDLLCFGASSNPEGDRKRWT
ncbi:hypothetical protein GY45DRAFT_1352557, partial [Cubamyces sp. BRFM 1775]